MKGELRAAMRLSTVARLLSSLILVGCSNPDTALTQNGVDHGLEPDTLSLADPAAREAQGALLADRPWRARRLLDAILTDSTRRTPEMLLLAARAAAALGEWPRVEALLERWRRPRRILGQDKGLFEVAEDFDAPLSDDLLADFEG